MFATLLVAAAAAPAAPLPADGNRAPAGPAPWLLHVKGDNPEQLHVLVQTQVVVKQTRSVVKDVDGKRVVEQQTYDVPQVQSVQRPLSDLVESAAAVDGTPVGFPELVRRAKDGVTVLVSADGKAVDRAWLRAVGPNTVVVTGKGFAGAVAPPLPVGVNRLVAPAPRLTLLTAGADGTVRVSTQPGGGRYPSTGRAVFMNNGGIVMIDEMSYAGPINPAPQVRPLSEITFDAYDLSGRLVPRDEAVRRLRAGGLVLTAAGRAPEAVHLQPFRGDLLVLVSSENLSAPGAAPATPAPALAPAVEVKPAIIRVAPAVLPAQPVPAPALRPVLRVAPAAPGRPAPQP